MASSDSEVTNPQKITFGEMRASGVRDVLIYCRDHRCSHHADGWADDVRHDGCVMFGGGGFGYRHRHHFDMFGISGF